MSHALALRLFLTAWVLFTLHASTNVVREHYPAFALVKTGSWRVDEYQGLHPDIFVHTDGHSYINNNVASSVLAAVPLAVFDPALDAIEAYDKARRAGGPTPRGGYRVDKPLRQKFFQQVTDRGLALRFGAATLITTAFLIAPLSALCVVAVFRILIDRGVSQGRAVWLALVFGFGTPVFFRSANLTPNAFVLYFTFAAFVLLWPRRGEAEPVAGWRRAAAGFCAGAALACDYSGAVPLVALSAYAVLRRWRTASLGRSICEFVPFVVSSAVPVGFLLVSQWAMFGHPLWPAQYWMPSANYTDRGWRGFALPTVETVLLNLLHPSYGLFAFGPLLLLGLLPACNPLVLPRAERVFAAGFAVLFVLFCAANQYSLMQWNTGFRYLLPVVPFAYLAACDHLARWPRWAVAAATVPAVLHTWILCMARDCNPNDDTWRTTPDIGTWLAHLAAETVPASYLRVGAEGLQLPWLRVLRLTAPENHPLLGAPWLPAATLALAAGLVAVIWPVGRATASAAGTHPRTDSSTRSRAPGVLP